MKKQLLGFLAGMLTMSLISSVGVSALAASGAFNITVDPINIQVNGQTFAPKDTNGDAVPVFAYEGTTYAPLRAISETCGLTVGYNARENMATVTGMAARMNMSDVYINDIQISTQNAEIDGNTFLAVNTLKDVLGYDVIEADGKTQIYTEPKAFFTVQTDKNGNSILMTDPENFSAGNYFLWDYLDVVFASDTVKGDVGSKIICLNVEDGTRINVSTQPGSTKPNNFIITPKQTLKLGETYSLFIPAGTIKFTNGTTYGEDISLLFKMAETVVKGKVSGSSLDIGTTISIIASTGERIDSHIRGGNEFFFVDVPAGKYQVEIDGKAMNSITVSEGKVNQVTVVPS